jgi:hypothetical protein
MNSFVSDTNHEIDDEAVIMVESKEEILEKAIYKEETGLNEKIWENSFNDRTFCADEFHFGGFKIRKDKLSNK